MTDQHKPYSPRDWTACPPYAHPPYKSSGLRAPSQKLIALQQTLSETTGPVYHPSCLGASDDDLTLNGQVNGAPVGERMIVTGRVLDDQLRPVPDTLVEVWQANAAGRYVHRVDQHEAPLDPNFRGSGRAVTDAGGFYRFTTIKPGAYCWGNHHNAWRPAHIHFSLLGHGFANRLVTQMYFPGDPLFEFDPIFNAISDVEARHRMVAKFSMDETQADFALGYVFDIVLRGRLETPMDQTSR